MKQETECYAEEDLASQNSRDHSLNVLNFGKLRQKVPDAKNIVYYRRGLDELSLNITNACPNACAFCIRDHNPGWGVSNLYLKEDPTVEEIKEAFNSEFERIRDSGVRLGKVKICGYGEPILRLEDLPEILQNISEKAPDVPIQLTTTGWPYFKITDNTLGLERLRFAGLSSIYLSLSSPYKEVYNRLVKPGVTKKEVQAFDDSLRFGLTAKEAGLEVTLGFINLAGIREEDAKDLAERMGVNYRIREVE